MGNESEMSHNNLLSASVLSVLHPGWMIQLVPFSSKHFHATPQWANPRGFAHKGFAIILLPFVPKRPKASCSYQVLLLWQERPGTNPSCPCRFPHAAFLSLGHLLGQPSGSFCSCPSRLRGRREGALSLSACPYVNASAVSNKHICFLLHRL